MAIQVTTPQNFQQLIETGKVDAFVPPEGGKKPDSAAKPDDTSKSAETPPRGADGKFTKAAEGDTSTTAGAKPEVDDDEGGDDLPEKARKVIGKKHRAMKEAEEFASKSYRERLAAETRAEQAEARLRESEAKSRPATAKTEEKPPPKPEDFATVAEYTDALTDYKVEKKFAAEKARQEQERLDAEKAAREREFAKRLVDAKTEFSDFDEVMSSLAGTEMDRVHQDVVEYLQESEHGVRLMYHLAKTPDTLERLRKLSPRRFIAELGKLETKWEKQPEAAVKLSEVAAAAPAPAVSKAPAPIQPLEGKNATVEKDPAKMNFQELREYERGREAQRRARH
jgi:hypothetical protein